MARADGASGAVLSANTDGGDSERLAGTCDNDMSNEDGTASQGGTTGTVTADKTDQIDGDGGGGGSDGDGHRLIVTIGDEGKRSHMHSWGVFQPVVAGAAQAGGTNRSGASCQACQREATACLSFCLDAAAVPLALVDSSTCRMAAWNKRMGAVLCLPEAPSAAATSPGGSDGLSALLLQQLVAEEDKGRLEAWLQKTFHCPATPPITVTLRHCHIDVSSSSSHPASAAPAASTATTLPCEGPHDLQRGECPMARAHGEGTGVIHACASAPATSASSPSAANTVCASPYGSRVTLVCTPSLVPFMARQQQQQVEEGLVAESLVAVMIIPGCNK
eukprot:TRINITY_DN26982_c0_g1_i1.p1 TRINITY_DN26982_c0_g1~~TRINITY_DN26982_c0_g1_i1.p1  ORF type:complete len:333 (+),score=12.60 TRINITY_DN26982_c0_g1_i1:355-1353(+)